MKKENKFWNRFLAKVSILTMLAGVLSPMLTSQTFADGTASLVLNDGALYTNSTSITATFSGSLAGTYVLSGSITEEVTGPYETADSNNPVNIVLTDEEGLKAVTLTLSGEIETATTSANITLDTISPRLSTIFPDLNPDPEEEEEPDGDPDTYTWFTETMLFEGGVMDGNCLSGATISVNGAEEELELDGEFEVKLFSTEITLAKGDNSIIVSATDCAGNTASSSGTIIYDDEPLEAESFIITNSGTYNSILADTHFFGDYLEGDPFDEEMIPTFPWIGVKYTAKADGYLTGTGVSIADENGATFSSSIGEEFYIVTYAGSGASVFFPLRENDDWSNYWGFQGDAPLPVGTYNITLNYITDCCGLTTTIVPLVIDEATSILTDKEAPTLTISNGMGTTYSDTYTLTGTLSETGSVEYFVSETNSGTTNTNEGLEFSIDLTALEYGENEITLTGSDLAGNATGATTTITRYLEVPTIEGGLVITDEASYNGQLAGLLAGTGYVYIDRYPYSPDYDGFPWIGFKYDMTNTGYVMTGITINGTGYTFDNPTIKEVTGDYLTVFEVVGDLGFTEGLRAGNYDLTYTFSGVVQGAGVYNGTYKLNIPNDLIISTTEELEEGDTGLIIPDENIEATGSLILDGVSTNTGVVFDETSSGGIIVNDISGSSSLVIDGSGGLIIEVDSGTWSGDLVFAEIDAVSNSGNLATAFPNNKELTGSLQIFEIGSETAKLTFSGTGENVSTGFLITLYVGETLSGKTLNIYKKSSGETNWTLVGAYEVDEEGIIEFITQTLSKFAVAELTEKAIDNCPNGDYTGNNYDGQCGTAPSYSGGGGGGGGGGGYYVAPSTETTTATTTSSNTTNGEPLVNQIVKAVGDLSTSQLNAIYDQLIKIPESKIPAQNKDIFDFLLNAIATELYFRTGETKTNGLGETTLSYEILAANYLASKNIIVNHSDNPEDYRLQDNVLRQEVAGVILSIIGKEKATEYKGYFEDVTETNPNDWAWASVEVLREAGIIASNKKFNPETNISKAETIGMIVKAIYGDAYNYDDTLGTSWQEQVIDFAYNEGILKEKFSDFDVPATRGFIFEVAAGVVK